MSAVIDSIQSLASRITSGDTDAESLLVEAYQNSVRLVLLKRTYDYQLSCDIAQDTFIVALRKLRAGEIRDPTKLEAFIHRISINLLIAHYRKERRYLYGDSGISGEEVTLEEDLEIQVDRLQIGQILRMILSKLGMERDRVVLRRYYLDEAEKIEICEELGLSSAHFDRVLYRAKKRMRKLVERHEPLKAYLKKDQTID